MRTPNRIEIPEAPVPTTIVPRLLRIPDAAKYTSCTYGYIETIIREKAIPSMILGKRRLIDIRDLDEFIDRMKKEKAA